ncbi:MAG: LysM peptidoglycan-binding domain-containing protein [Nitrospira sp.]|nr:LysM peptidoglycan-binding domain-containing protein [Nitrospira sp.]
MIQRHVPARRTGVGLRLGYWLAALLVTGAWGGCARVTPNHEPVPSDLQVAADSLKVAVREAQRTAAELRTELDEQRKELADAQVARAQLQGMLRETERRLTEARQIIELQREELTSARDERERLAQAVHPFNGHVKASSAPAPSRSKKVPAGQDAVVLGSVDMKEVKEEHPLADQEPPAPQPLLLHREATQDSSRSQASAVRVAPLPKGTAVGTTIVVQGGDTLWRLARRHKVEVAVLRALNGLSGDRIVAGRKLRLPESEAQHAAVQPATLDTLVQ